MNIGTITTMGTKGQIVIPQKIREALAIDQSTPLQITLSTHGITIHPVIAVIRKVDQENSYSAILAKTKGTWAHLPDDYAAYRKREKVAAKKMRSW